MTELHPTFVVRDAALVEACRRVGITLGHTGECRSRATQIRLRAEKGLLAANPFAVGPISPWGWRSYGSLHMEQHDGYCHAIDYRLITGGRWSQVHSIALGYGIVFPLARRRELPEPWHGQFWTAQASGGLRPAPRLEELGIPLPDAPPYHRDDPPAVPARRRGQEETDMYESLGIRRQEAAHVVDFTNLPGDGTFGKIVNRSVVYVRRLRATSPPSHVRIFCNGAPLTPVQGADVNGFFYLPDDGRPIAVRVHAEGFWSVEGYGNPNPQAPDPQQNFIAVAQAQSWFTG